ncbi:amino acid ABC transporter permease [Nocardioides massiliensis]|uniref:Glutamate transport system permease protein n=1 Tax=Nocardioides massiliensis TaxID=1325935 RepID=A0ABT9NQJ0_9ACTN|nr:amino acid ABC transporter permease [Nocardioides massiliensis]MDP9822701.1 glutamate transport system permease protein [Nocardioides massiliensis]
MSAAPSVLYDIPGPRARRRALIGTVAVLALVAVAVYFAARRLADRGQFDGDLWAPVFNPSDENFPLVWDLLGKGLVATLTAAALAIAFSLLIGTALGSARMLLAASHTRARWLRYPIVVLIELFRGLPVVISIFLSYHLFRYAGFRLTFLPGEELMWYVVVGLTVYNSVIIAEILRAGVASLPRGQAEAGRATGMTEGAIMRLVLLPQAFRVMLPALISQLVVIVKDTSLGTFIAYSELLNRSLRISQNLDNPIQMLLVAAVLFIAINYALSRLAVWTEHRLSHSKRGTTAQAEPEQTGAVAGA